MKYALALVALLPMIAFATDTEVTPTTQYQQQDQNQFQVQNNQQTSEQANYQVLTVEDRKQAPSLGQGSVFIPDCGVGGNAGGSNSNGSAFLGIAYVPAWCQDFKYAAWLVSVGDYDAACQVMASSKVGKRAAEKGIVPKCVKPAPAPEPKPTVVVLTGESCASNSERVDRVLEKCVGK